MRLRSDEQLVALLRSGHDEAFQAIYDRYRARLFAYMRQMLPLRQDVEDALQEVFERAYCSLRVGERELALRPWLYRIAHNRCIDQLRRPAPPPPEAMLQIGAPPRDPVTEADARETLRRLLQDVRRLPEQQRSALLMRELGGISYADVAQALGITVPAVKSLLVRARVSLAAAGVARDTACEDIRAELVLAHESRVRPNSMARRHLRDCPGCREFRGNLRTVRRGLLAVAPTLGPIGLLARLLGGGSASSSAAGGGATAAAAGGAGASGLAGSGMLAGTGAIVSGAGHVATLLAATVVTAGGAAALSHTASSAAHRPHARPAATVHHGAAPRAAAAGAPARSPAPSSGPATGTAATVSPAAVSTPAATSTVTHPRRAVAATVTSTTDNSLAPMPDPAPVSTSGDPASSSSPPSTSTPAPTSSGSPSSASSTGTATSPSQTATTPTSTPNTGTPASTSTTGASTPTLAISPSSGTPSSSTTPASSSTTGTSSSTTTGSGTTS